MASLMEDFIDVLEKENEEYERLTELSTEKRQIIINGDVPALEDMTGKEQEITSNLKNLENRRQQVVKDMAIVLSKKPEELTITNMIAFLDKQPEEQQKLQDIRERLKATLTQMADINTQNEILLTQAMEMVEFDLTLFKSMRQAPTTANYDKRANNTGDVLGSRGFDAKQ
ncbi:flagellar protein FlgN [Roseburia sp. 499]|uniref:flagellar protein FlgN n=1 Tax=Roseburia sp. 499 TaxID=1261634 RepID=UPI000B0E6BE7|nr:flagellar protein FlgN [Roseburia sp. 499]WVK70006.1 flagellar protein FlgN [Roseburia sp. 499]